MNVDHEYPYQGTYTQEELEQQRQRQRDRVREIFGKPKEYGDRQREQRERLRDLSRQHSKGVR